MTKAKILLVDDDPIILSSSTMMLRKLRHEVVQANSGSEAIKIIENTEFDCKIILLDLMMPDIDGVEVLRRTKNIIKDKNIHVILQSGSCDQALIDQAKSLGAEILLSKPYDLNKMEVALSQFNLI